jgi:hypothetical protein
MAYFNSLINDKPLLNIQDMFQAKNNVYGNYGTQVPQQAPMTHPNPMAWQPQSSLDPNHINNTHQNQQGVQIDPNQAQPEVSITEQELHDSKPQESNFRIKRGFNPQYYAASNAVQGLARGLSNLSGNSYGKAVDRFNNQKSSFDNIGITNYSTQQDQYGSNTYMQKGGSVFNMMAQEAMAEGDFDTASIYGNLSNRRDIKAELAMRQQQQQEVAQEAPVSSRRQKTYMDHSQPYKQYERRTPFRTKGTDGQQYTSWAKTFKQVEDPGSKFNHGNDAYGTFGYRKTGHLREAYSKSPEFADVRKQYGNYNKFWKDFTKGGYNELSAGVDRRYEQWLRRRSGGDLNKAASINYVGHIEHDSYTPKGQRSVGEYKRAAGIFRRGGNINTTGYTPGTASYNNPYNIIPSGNITMQNTPFPVMGIDNTGHKQMMRPGGQYNFPGSHVLEIPFK